jgi:hypothetical protein
VDSANLDFSRPKIAQTLPKRCMKSYPQGSNLPLNMPIAGKKHKKMSKNMIAFTQMVTYSEDQPNWRDDRSCILLKYFCSSFRRHEIPEA